MLSPLAFSSYPSLVAGLQTQPRYNYKDYQAEMFPRVLAFLFGAERTQWLPCEEAIDVFCSMFGHVYLW